MRRILNLFFYFLTNFEKKMGELRPKTERKSAAVKLVFWRRAALCAANEARLRHMKHAFGV
mgnify:CR=1 FL=1